MGAKRLFRAAKLVFYAGAAVFFGGLVAMVPMSLLAFVLPSWWQHVWAAVALPTMAALPVWIGAGLVGALIARLRPEARP